MKRKNWLLVMALGIVSLLFSGCSLLEGLLFTKPDVDEFSFSGFVSADGEALAGAKVDCGIASCETDEDGNYKFEKITKVVQVKVEKEGYLFKDDLVFVSSTSNGVDFKGYKLFDKSGIVKNGDTVIPDVEILATSETGDYTTKTNEYGEFYLPNLAGQVKVKANLSPFKFFTQSFTIAKEDKVIITGTTDILGMIKTDSSDATKQDFTLMVGSKIVDIQDNLTFLATDVEPGTEITLTSDKYYIANPIVKIGSTVENVTFNCEKIYSVTGKIMCGDKLINNATLSVGKRLIVSSDGNFVINNLHGKNYINCSLSGYHFETNEVSGETELNVLGKFNVMGSVNLDYGVDYSGIILKVNNQEFKVDMLGKFTLNKVAFGDEIEVVSNDYNLTEKIKITSLNAITINLYKYFNCDIVLKQNNQPLENVLVVAGDNEYTTDSDGKIHLQNLSQDVGLKVSKDGYKFEDAYLLNNAIAERVNNEFVINGYKLYNITGKVKSGNIPLVATINYGKDSVQTNELGEFAINDAFSDVILSVTATNYNVKTINVTMDNSQNLDIIMTYNVSGKVVSNSVGLDGVEILLNNVSTNILTDYEGEFELDNLTGENKITFAKDYYTFDELNIKSGCNLEINSNYKISGQITQKDGESISPLANFKVTLLNLANRDTVETSTDNYGNYSFDNLNGEYVLAYDNSSSLSLKPRVYKVTTGGNTFDFSNSGFSFGGKITCGDKPLDGVVVRMGDKTTRTKDGIYNFELVSKADTITLYKEGYAFSGNNFAIDDSFDERQDIDFTATYKITGAIKSGKTPLSGVSIKVSDLNDVEITTTESKDDGTYEIVGLSDTVKIAVSYLDYIFEGEREIAGYAKLNYMAYLNVTTQIISGDIKISDADVYVNNNAIGKTDSEGKINLNRVSLNDTITAKKDGYEIDTYNLDYATNIIVGATYSIAGRVTNSGSNLENVKLTLSGSTQTYYTNKHGRFEINGIVGTNIVTFELDKFEFDPITINGANLDCQVMSKYSVEGTIKVGGVALPGMIVKAGNITATTNAQGYFILSGLTTIETLEFEKDGYSVDGIIQVSKHEILDISATYTLKGIVRSGDIIIAGAKVVATDGNNIWDDTTSDDGSFAINGLTGKVTVTITKDGYNGFQKDISTFTPSVASLNAQLSYNVVITFDDNYVGVKVSVNGELNGAYSYKTITLENLFGVSDITFAKDQCAFTPAQLQTKESCEKEVSVKLIYSLSGKVQTSNGIAISNAKVKLELGDTSKEVLTDDYGKYKFDGISGYPWITAILPSIKITDTDSQTLKKQVSKNNISGTALDFSFDTKDFGLNILNFGYDTLRGAKNYQILGDGTVVPNTSLSGTQNVKVTYKKDSLGHKIFENRNYGEVKIVDTNVSLLSCFDMNSDTVKYNQVFGKSNVATNGSSVSYGSAWTTTNRASYLNEFGINWDGFSPYTVNKDTIKSVTNLERKTIGGEDCYSYKIILNHENSASYANYEKIMKKMCEMQTPKGFSKIELTITITTEGYLRKMGISEDYKVEAKGVTVSTTGNITYNFYINSMTEQVIQDIDVSSPQTVYEAVVRGKENINTLSTARPHNFNSKVDYVACKKETTYEEI